MNKRNYNEVVKELIAAGIFAQQGTYFSYEGNVLSQEYQGLFDFAQEFLDRTDLPFIFKAGRFYYNDRPEINALAYADKDFSIIELYEGTVRRTYNFYFNTTHLFSKHPLNIYVQATNSLFNITPGYFLFQYVMLYLVYHETGHLIQRLQGSANYEEFIAGSLTVDQVKERHIREYDADWFAANQLGITLVQGSKGGQQIQELTELALAGIYMYFIKHAESLPEIYYDQKSHPHPSVRLSYMIIHILDSLAANNITIDKNKALSNAILISEALMKSADSNIIEKYSIQLYQNIDSVEEYIQVIQKNSENYPYLSRKAYGY